MFLYSLQILQYTDDKKQFIPKYFTNYIILGERSNFTDLFLLKFSLLPSNTDILKFIKLSIFKLNRKLSKQNSIR